MLDIAGLWKAPFRIDRQTQVATYGSCFAQHFSRSLVERGYSWLNAETGMPGMPAELQREFSYGVFSARTGNIYTASLFRQWVGWALEGIRLRRSIGRRTAGSMIPSAPRWSPAVLALWRKWSNRVPTPSAPSVNRSSIATCWCSHSA